MLFRSGALFKFDSHDSAKAFKKHVDSCPKRTCDADLDINEELKEGSFKYHMDKAVAAHDRGDEKKKMYHLGNAKTARYAMKTSEYSKHKDLLDKYKQMSEGTELDEGLKHHVAAAAIAVAGALGGHAHAQSAPQHDTSKPAATATAQDSDKSPHDGAPKAEHKARIDKAESEGTMTRGDANVERMKHGLRPSFGRVRMNQESVQMEAKSTSGAYEKAQENKRSADDAKKQGDMFAHHLHMSEIGRAHV